MHREAVTMSGQLIFQKAVMEVHKRNSALFQQMVLRELGIYNNNNNKTLISISCHTEKITTKLIIGLNA